MSNKLVMPPEGGFTGARMTMRPLSVVATLHLTSAVAVAGAITLLAPSSSAHAQAAPEPPPPSLPEGPAPEGQSLQEQIEELRLELRRRDELERERKSRLSIGGYLDFGFFAPNGNRGVGWVRDEANHQFPEFTMPGPHGGPYSWTFLGDILATPVNTRGEPADLGDAPGIDRFDSVDSDGAPGFLVNEANIRLEYQLASQALVRTSVDFAPRSGRRDFDLGDVVDVDLAELEYVLTEDGGTSVFVGKSLPVFGIEYRERKSHQRFGITPSLLHRYTAGSQLGIKLRSKLLSDWVILAASVTNNSSTTEQFHFQSEIDHNWGKTMNGRAALSVPVGDAIGLLAGDRLELGVSGEWGAQDRSSNSRGDIWFAGLDLQYLSANFALKAQVMRGAAPGSPDERVWGLDLRNSGYVELNWQFLSFLGVLGRAEVRDALVTLGNERVYLTKTMRFTGGVRVVFNPHAVLKAEYLHNREYGGIAQFDNDIFTSSLVLAF
jgi:hypothetical protein